LSATAGQKWETVKSPPRNSLESGLVSTTAPVRTSRTILEGSGGTRAVSFGRDSAIVYDPREHRFVNTNSAPPSLSRGPESTAEKHAPGTIRNDRVVEAGRNNAPRGTSERVPAAPTSARASTPPSRSIAPPPAPRSSGGGEFRGGGPVITGGGGSSRGSAAPSAPAPHVSTPSGGGRPH
jgi:hypothetical protein